MSNWAAAFKLEDIPPLGARTLALPNAQVAVFRAENDEVFAIEDSCPHKKGPLSQGIVHGAQVTCPLHAWVIDLKTGSALAPDIGCVKTFAVRVTDGIVEVDTESLDSQTAA
jgi:nitrite reductase (NADH) small subunit